jgi:hypothetical protein
LELVIPNQAATLAEIEELDAQFALYALWAFGIFMLGELGIRIGGALWKSAKQQFGTNSASEPSAEAIGER